MTWESAPDGGMPDGQALDGNILGGRLGDVFAFEPTAALATCSGCGTRSPVATWVVFTQAPGVVARCSTCQRVQLRIVQGAAGRTWVDLSGVESLELTAPR